MNFFKKEDPKEAARKAKRETRREVRVRSRERGKMLHIFSMVAAGPTSSGKENAMRSISTIVSSEKRALTLLLL